MRRIITILIVGLLSFGLGWWTNDMWKFADGVIADGKRLDSLQNKKPLFTDSLKNTQTTTAKKKIFKDYISDDQFTHWAPKNAGYRSYMCEITLHKITVLYWYHGQCGYDYFTYLTSDTTIDVVWSYRSDCILNMDFLEKSNGVKKYPKLGDIFATLTLVNDTTIEAKYDFPEWAKRFNEIDKDSLFPTNYYLKNDNY